MQGGAREQVNGAVIWWVRGQGESQIFTENGGQIMVLGGTTERSGVAGDTWRTLEVGIADCKQCE